MTPQLSTCKRSLSLVKFPRKPMFRGRKGSENDERLFRNSELAYEREMDKANERVRAIKYVMEHKKIYLALANKHKEK